MGSTSRGAPALLRHFRFDCLEIYDTTFTRPWPHILYVIKTIAPDFVLTCLIAPARDAVDFERVRFDGSFIIESPFTGAPRPEQDSAWHDLLQSM